MFINTLVTALPTDRIYALAKILGEFSEIFRSGGDATAHAANCALGLIGADAGGFVLAPVAQPQPGENMIAASLAGFTASEQQEILAFYSERCALDIAGTAMLKLDSVGIGLCCLRRELVSDHDWYESEFVNEYCRRWRIDDSIYGGLTADGGRFAGIGCFRSWGSKPFTDEDRALLQALAIGCNGHVFERTPLVNLSRRQREILDCLLTGDSAKQMALKLGLSIHTVNEYVQAVYLAHGVNTKAALLARVLRPAHRYVPVAHIP